MKRQGFSYISALLSVVLVGIIFLSVAHISILASENKQKFTAQKVLTNAEINIIEALKLEVSQGVDISDYVITTALSLYDGISGNVGVKKEYALTGAAVYLVNFDLKFMRARLKECVVIYCNE